MSEAFQAVKLPVAEIEASGAVQVRCRIDHHTVAEYAEAIKAGAIMPPLVVFSEKGSERYLLADGFHRLAALKANEIEEVACHRYEGGLHEALEYALAANDTHGLRRNNKDKRNAVMLALKDPQWTTWSAADISRLCRVSAPLVVKIREDMVLAGEIEEQETLKSVRGGKVVERKAARGSSSKNFDERLSSKKSTLPPRRQPKSQDQSDRDEFDAALTAINGQVHDGAEKARRWYSAERKRAAELAIDYLQGFVSACNEIEKKNAA